MSIKLFSPEFLFPTKIVKSFDTDFCSLPQASLLISLKSLAIYLVLEKINSSIFQLFILKSVLLNTEVIIF